MTNIIVSHKDTNDLVIETWWWRTKTFKEHQQAGYQWLNTGGYLDIFWTTSCDLCAVKKGWWILLLCQIRRNALHG